MTWTKLSDDFSDDCWELSDAAVRLHMEGLVWSNRKLLDCRLVKDEMVRWAKRPGAAEELVAAGWWRDDDTVYLIVHTRYLSTRPRGRAEATGRQPEERSKGRPGGGCAGVPYRRCGASALESCTDVATASPAHAGADGG